MKRYWHRMLSLMLAWLLLPALLPAELAEWVPMTTAYAAESVTISSAEDWNRFAESGASDAQVTLTADITLSGDIPTKDYFNGTFDGQGYVITIQSGSVLTPKEGTDQSSVGLFGRLDKATVKNLVIQIDNLLEGTHLTSIKISEGNDTDLDCYNFGVLAGSAENGTRVSNVAVMAGDAGGSFRAVVNRWQTADSNVGGLCGYSDGSTFEQCYVGINVHSWRMLSTNEAILRTGGLLGCARNTTITDCMVASGEIKNHHSNPGLQDNTAGQAAGLVCTVEEGTSIKNCVIDGVQIVSRDVAESIPEENAALNRFGLNNVNRGTTGLAYAINNGATVSDCYAYNNTEMQYGGRIVYDGAVNGTSAESQAKSALGKSDAWVSDTSGHLGLAWMYQIPEVALQSTGDGSVNLTVSQKATNALRAAVTTWEYTIKASLRGQNATPQQPSAALGSDPVVSSIEIVESRQSDTGSEYYSGGTYQFYARITGQNLTEENTPVTWELQDVPKNEGVSAATISNTGLLSINQDFFGSLTVKATAGGQTDTYELAVIPAKLTILTPKDVTTVEQGAQVDFGIRIESYRDTASGAEFPVKWSVSGGKSGTSIDENGVLTVAANETVGTQLTITAQANVESMEAGEQELLKVDSVTLKVAKNTIPEEVVKEVSPAATAQKLSVELVTGQKLQVKLDAQAPAPTAPPGYNTEAVDDTFTVSCSPEEGALQKDGETSFLAASAGAATVTATRTLVFEEISQATPESARASRGIFSSLFAKSTAVQAAAGTTEVKWTSEISVTVKDRTVPKAEDENVTMSPVAGDTAKPELDTTENLEYRLVFPVDTTGVQYRMSIVSQGEPTPSGAWKDLPEDNNVVVLSKEQVQALKAGTLYLWMRQKAADDLAASNTVGYSVKEAEGTPVLTVLESYPADNGLEAKSGIEVTGQWTVRNGEIEGPEQPFNVLELLKQGDPYLEKYTSLNTGEVRVTVRQAGGNYKNRGSLFTVEGSASLAVGNAMLKPTIQPRESGQLTNYSFTIDVPDQKDSQVYYQIYPNVSTVQPSEYPGPTNGGIKYTAGTQVPYPTGEYQMVTVVAVTYSTDAGSTALPSDPDIVTFTAANLNAPSPPELRIGEQDAEFVGNQKYVDGEIFKFVYDTNLTGGQTEPYQVYYTINGKDPVPGQEGTLYDPNNPPKLQFNISTSLTIKAIVYDPNYGTRSSVVSYTVERRSNAAKPVADVETGTLVRPGQELTLELAPDFVANLANLGSIRSAEYVEYSADSPVFSAYADYIRSDSAEPIEGVGYLLIDTGSSGSTTELPSIKYLLNNTEDSLKESGANYRYAVCQVWNAPDSSGEQKNYIRFTNPDPIALSGSSGDKLTLRAMTVAPTGVTSYLDSEEAVFTYTIRGTLASPQSVPQTDGMGSTAVDIGESIALTAEADTEIYYTTNGTQPQVTWVEQSTAESAGSGHWEAANEVTFKYVENITVPRTNSKLFIINAIAVSVNDTMETSPLASFVYTVNPLTQAAVPMANPVTDSGDPTRLANGERITLTSSTLNTDIYYTVDGSVPSSEARDEWDAGYAAAAEKGQDPDGTRWYTDAQGVKQKEPATRVYDVQQGIAMTATEEQQFFTVTAMAVDRDRTTPKNSSSDAVSFVYRLAQVEAPSASPVTSDAEVAVVEPGMTIVLTSNTVGAKIYYTKDTTNPDLTDRNAVDKAYEEWYAGWSAAAENNRGTDGKGIRWYLDSAGNRKTEPSTIPYDPAEGITMPSTVTTFLTLRAVAVVEDGSRAASDVVTISYQPPAAVNAVYASPVDGSAVEYGTAVTLSCATDGAQIFYKVYTSQPAEGDVPVANKDLGYSGPITITKEVWIRAVAVRSNVESAVTTYHYTVAPTAEAPTASLPGGSVVPKGTRISLSGEGTIVYTLDGSDPKEADSEKLYGTTVNLDGDYGATITVRAYIQRDGYTPSDTVSFGYTICKEEDYLTISVDSGSVIANDTSVTLSTAITNGRIFYTLDGSTPQVSNVYSDGNGKNYTTYEWSAGSSSTIEGSGFTLSGNPDTAVTVRAIVVVNGGDGGQVQTFTYKFQPQAAAPTASIPSGAVVFEGATVTLTAKEGTIYYTTDGTNPTTSSAIYSNPIDVSGGEGTVLKAIAVVDGKAPSEVAVFSYTRAGQVATPVFSIPSGEIDTGTTVEITTATEGATIYYSTDGTEPTADNIKELTMYVAPISITRAVTIKAIAVSDKQDESAVQSATYTVKKPEPQPTESPEDEVVQNTVTDRLTSRRTYNSVGDGPSYSDVVLRENVCNTVLSAPAGSVPDGAVLTVKQVDPTRSDENSVQSSLGQKIALVYEAQLTLDGDMVQPSGEVELGFAVPAEYQNGVVTVSLINDDGTLTQYTARRSGGIAYIKTNSMGRFAVSVPKTSDQAGTFLPFLLWGGGAAVLAGLLLVALYRRRRNAAGEAAVPQDDSEYQSLEEFFETSDTTSSQ